MMLDLCVAELSTSHTELLLLLYGKVTECTDFRALGRVTRFNAEPMPSSNEIFAKLKGCKYLSNLDCHGLLSDTPY